MPPCSMRRNVISSMKLLMRKMPRPLALRRFSGASGSASVEGSKPHPSSRTRTAMPVQPAQRMRGRVRPPGDKSISHRYAMLAAIADGPSVIHGYSTGADCASTLNCLRALGVPIEQVKRARETGIQLDILGLQVGGLHPPTSTLDAGN